MTLRSYYTQAKHQIEALALHHFAMLGHGPKAVLLFKQGMFQYHQQSQPQGLLRLLEQLSPQSASQVGVFASLNTREREILQLLSAGNPVRDIAHALGLSLATLDFYLRNIRQKLHVDELLAICPVERPRRVRVAAAEESL